MLLSPSLLLVLCAHFTFGLGSNDDLPLRVLYIGSSSPVEALDRAEEDINNSSSLLSGYRVQIVKGNSTMCNRKQSLDVFYSHLFNDTFLAVIAGVCSLDAEVLATVAQYYHLTLISFTTSSKGPDEDQLYPYYFHLVPSLSNAALAIANFVSYCEFDWNRAVIVTQDEDNYKRISQVLSITLTDRNFTVKNDIILSEGLTSITEDQIFLPNYRIYILNMNSTLAKIVFCQAISAGLQRYRYVWIIPGTYKDGWLNEDITQTKFEYECLHTTAEIEAFAYDQRIVAISHFPHAHQNETNVTILTNKTTGSLEKLFGGDDLSLLAYDSVLTISKSLDEVTSNNADFNVSDFSPLSSGLDVSGRIGESIKNSTQDVTLRGASGKVKLEDRSRETGFARIFQYRNESYITSRDLVGLIDLRTEEYVDSLLFLDGDSSQSILKLWPEGVPQDGEPIPVTNYPLLPIVIISYIYSGAVIICSLVCLATTFVFRKRKLIRLTSPNLNYIIGIGIIVFCCSVFMFVYPPLPTGVLVYHCGIRSWFAAIGYSLCFGTINTKMWRVYYIFHDIKPTSNKKAIKDWHLFLVVTMFVTVDVFILIVATSLSATRLHPEIVPDKEFGNTTNEEGITIEYNVILCEARYKTLWLVVLFGYKVVIQIIGVFLAFKIRKVKIKVLNDSKEVAITLYVTSIILAAVIIITVAFDDYLNVYSTMYSLGIPLSSSVVLGVVYMSKMVRLYKDPKGETIFTHVTNDATGAAGGTGYATCDHDRVIVLEKKVKELQAQLATNEGNENIYISYLESDSEEQKNGVPSQKYRRKKQVRIEGHEDHEGHLEHDISV